MHEYMRNCHGSVLYPGPDPGHRKQRVCNDREVCDDNNVPGVFGNSHVHDSLLSMTALRTVAFALSLMTAMPIDGNDICDVHGDRDVCNVHCAHVSVMFMMVF